MSKIINTAKTLRRHWKKSIFFFSVTAYGASYFFEKYRTFQMMRAYCEEAKKFGEKPLLQMTKPKHITVILNPEANNKKANVQFEKFVAPLLHLAGFKVSVFQTEKEKQAQDLMQIMSNTDAVLVAGGNGTLQEAITGLLRRTDDEKQKLPLGIVPLGKTNTVANFLFGSKSSSNAQLMAEAVMAVIRETTVSLDVLKIQYADEENPVFAMCSFEQGIFADVEPLVQKYWYFGTLKDKFTYFINALKNWKRIENKSLQYVEPCDGCSKCFIPPKRKEAPEQGGRWWQVFVPKKQESIYIVAQNEQKLASKVNEDCGKHISLLPTYSTISASTITADSMTTSLQGSLWIKIFPKDLSFSQFILSGLSHQKSKCQDSTGIATIIPARELIIETDNSHPTSSIPVQVQTSHQSAGSAEELTETNSMEIDNSDITDQSTKNTDSETSSTDVSLNDVNETEQFTYIDNEKYKRASCSITLLPKQVTIYG